MIEDRNKTPLTHEVTAATMRWMDQGGFKPVETEVTVSLSGEKAWIADIAGLIEPTQTELVDMGLIPRPPRYSYQRPNIGYKEKREAWEEKYRVFNRLMTAVVEVKTQRSDFVGDRKWGLESPADISFVALSPGVAREEEVPLSWGILVLRDGEMKKIRNPIPRQSTINEQFLILYSTAIRRDHRTRYALQREMQKRDRIEGADRRSMEKMVDVVEAVVDVSKKAYPSGEPVNSVEEAFARRGIKNIPFLCSERLSSAFGVPASTKENL